MRTQELLDQTSGPSKPASCFIQKPIVYSGKLTTVHSSQGFPLMLPPDIGIQTLLPLNAKVAFSHKWLVDTDRFSTVL